MIFFLLLCLTIGLTSCSVQNTTHQTTSIIPDEHYPRWMKTESYRTNQTSGITFIREDEFGTELFLLVDDVGKIHRLEISDDTVFIFKSINFSTELSNFLNTFNIPSSEISA